MMRSFLIRNNPNSTPTEPIEFDDEDDSELSILNSEDVLTLDGDPSLKALQEAKTDAEYDLIVAQLPHDKKIKIGGIQFVRFTTFQKKNQKKRAWFWKHGEELVRTTKGKLSLNWKLIPTCGIKRRRILTNWTLLGQL